MKKKESDPRYPYTHACDLVRSASPWGKRGCLMSRATASQIRQLVSLALGVDDKEVAEKLANTFLRYEPMIHLFEDDNERFVPPEDAISFKIVSIAGIKQAHWLQPRSDIEVRDINFCSECEFMSKASCEGASICCLHPRAHGLMLPNHDREIHPECPIKTVKEIKVRHADGEYVRNVIQYAKGGL